MTEQEFINKYVGKAVHCDTEEKAKELLKLAHGFEWDISIETYWYVHKENTCYRIGNDKTTGYSSLDFYKSQGWEVLEFESEKKKMKKTKKVIDLWMFVDYMQKQKISNGTIVVSDDLIKEVEVDVELTEHEIEVLKALKLLDFNWIARDKNNILFAYEAKPTKRSEFFHETGRTMRLNQTLFSFITWQDEEVTSIDDLL